MSYSIKLFLVLVSLIFIVGCSTKQNTPYIPGSYGHAKSSAAIHRATMRPYEVGGRRYYPTVVEVGTTYRGIASWYGPNFHGKRTSNGEIYDMHAFTAAHKTLPMNTMVKVTNLKNGKSTVVRINDRGPFVGNRIIDLSYAAAKKIGMIGRGTAPVRIEVLGFDSHLSSLTGSKERIVIDDFAVQIGSFRRYAGASITKKRNSLVHGRYKAIIKRFDIDGKPLYRVWLTGFKSEAEARDFIATREYPGAFIIRNE